MITARGGISFKQSATGDLFINKKHVLQQAGVKSAKGANQSSPTRNLAKISNGDGTDAPLSTPPPPQALSGFWTHEETMRFLDSMSTPCVAAIRATIAEVRRECRIPKLVGDTVSAREVWGTLGKDSRVPPTHPWTVWLQDMRVWPAYAAQMVLDWFAVANLADRRYLIEAVCANGPYYICPTPTVGDHGKVEMDWSEVLRPGSTYVFMYPDMGIATRVRINRSGMHEVYVGDMRRSQLTLESDALISEATAWIPVKFVKCPPSMRGHGVRTLRKWSDWTVKSPRAALNLAEYNRANQRRYKRTLVILDKYVPWSQTTKAKKRRQRKQERGGGVDRNSPTHLDEDEPDDCTDEPEPFPVMEPGRPIFEDGEERTTKRRGDKKKRKVGPSTMRRVSGTQCQRGVILHGSPGLRVAVPPYHAAQMQAYKNDPRVLVFDPSASYPLSPGPTTASAQLDSTWADRDLALVVKRPSPKRKSAGVHVRGRVRANDPLEDEDAGMYDDNDGEDLIMENCGDEGQLIITKKCPHADEFAEDEAPPEIEEEEEGDATSMEMEDRDATSTEVEDVDTTSTEKTKKRPRLADRLRQSYGALKGTLPKQTKKKKKRQSA